MKIQGDRLYFRDWTENDVDAMVDGLNNINVSKWLAFVPYPYTKQDALNFINRPYKENEYKFAIVLKTSNEVIGGTTLNVDNFHRVGTGGIWLNSKFKGKGYGTEAFNLRAKFAFENLGLRKLENGYFKGNLASLKMQQKLGYKKEGVRKKKYICMATGKIHDEILTALFKEDWLKNK